MDKDLNYGAYALLVGIFVAVGVSTTLGMVIFLGIALYYGGTGLLALFSTSAPSSSSYAYHSNAIESRAQPVAAGIQPTTSAPITNDATIAEQIKAIHAANHFKCPSCGATVNPTDKKCGHCGSFLVASANLPTPAKWGDIEIGQALRVSHPTQGELSTAVVYRVYYGELWQAVMRRDVPWTLTGSYYVGLGLNNNMLLLNWQSRFYILDAKTSLNDMLINQNFSAPARQFAASNQTRKVSFMYEGASWEIFDIGRFRIEYAEGGGIPVSAGAVGRFIHASKTNQALVVEDYQSGGSGLDTLWRGYQISENDIKF